MVATKLKQCLICGHISIPRKRVEGGVICSKCYKPPKQKCSVCEIFKTVAKWDGDKPICHKCYKAPKETCSICQVCRTVAKRREDGAAICPCCYYKEYDYPMGNCSKCGNLSIVYSRINEKILCESCYMPPEHVCIKCGKLAPSSKRIGEASICNTCYSKNVKSICSICGELRRISVSLNGILICSRCRTKQRYNKDKNFRLIRLLRSRFQDAMKTYSKSGKIKKSKEYGIDYGAIIEHLKPFPSSLSKFHIDHIFPLSAFDFNDELQIKAAFVPENHQWLDKFSNLSKNNSYDKEAFKQFLIAHGCEGEINDK